MDDTNDADMDETTDGDKMFCEGSTGVDVQDRDARSRYHCQILCSFSS